MKASDKGVARLLPAAVLSAMILVRHDVAAADTAIAVGEVTLPPAIGVDAARVRSAAEVEIRRLAPTLPRTRRRVVVSLALTPMAIDGPVMCTVNATLRDARTGTMIAIIEADAHAEGPGSAELRMRVAQEAVKTAVRKIPRALGGK